MTTTRYTIGSSVEVPCEQIVLKEWPNRFKRQEQLPIEDLVADMRVNGQLTDALSYQNEDGTVTPIGGHRRYQACLRNGKPLRCKIIAKPKTAKEEVLLRHGDNVALHKSTMDKAVEMGTMVKAGLKQETIAQQFVNAAGKHISREYVSMCLKLLNIVGPAQELIHRGVKGCGAKWGMDLGALPAAEQLLECERMAQGESDVLTWIRDEMSQKGIQTPEQAEAEDVMDDSEVGEGGESEGGETAKPLQQRTLTHVKECLVACIESDKVDETHKSALRVLLDFTSRREAKATDVAKALATDANMAKALHSIDMAEKKAAKEAEHSAEAKTARAAEERKAMQAEREKAAVNAIVGLKAAGWLPMKGGESRWKDPTNERAPYVPTMEAWATQLQRSLQTT